MAALAVARIATRWLVSLLAAVTLMAVALPAHARALPAAQPPTPAFLQRRRPGDRTPSPSTTTRPTSFLAPPTRASGSNCSSKAAAANFEVRGANNVVYKALSDPSLNWTYTLPETQDYRITVSTSTQAFYTLVVTLPAGGTPQRITFAPGQTTATVTGNTPPA